jgi:ornithine carbamoyltransferase
MDSPMHFLDIDVLAPETLRSILDDSARRKTDRIGRGQAEPDPGKPLAGRLLAMVFEKPSTRTRVSFDVAMRQLGGETLLLQGSEMQLGRGETIADTARVLSRYVDAIMIRTSAHDNLLEMANHATVPVINGLTDRSHPCQVMADILTFEEHRGPIRGRAVAWCGDGNNMATTWMHAAVRFGVDLRLACPPELMPAERELAWARANGARVMVTTDPEEAVQAADCVITDTWVSMGDRESERRHNLLAPYRVTRRLMSRARRDALFMHCLPAHRGEDVDAEVIDGPQSVVWDEAGNRLHVQKGILAWCLAGH